MWLANFVFLACKSLVCSMITAIPYWLRTVSSIQPFFMVVNGTNNSMPKVLLSDSKVPIPWICNITSWSLADLYKESTMSIQHQKIVRFVSYVEAYPTRARVMGKVVDSIGVVGEKNHVGGEGRVPCREQVLVTTISCKNYSISHLRGITCSPLLLTLNQVEVNRRHARP